MSRMQWEAGIASSLVSLALLTGCSDGGPAELGAPPPEPSTVPGAMHTSALPNDVDRGEAPPPEILRVVTGEGGPAEALAASAAPVQGPRSLGEEAAIRTHLADRFVFQPWYPHVHEVIVKRDVALVFASLPAGGGARQKSGQTICIAVLGSHRVEEVRVRGGSRPPITCRTRKQGSQSG